MARLSNLFVLLLTVASVGYATPVPAEVAGLERRAWEDKFINGVYQGPGHAEKRLGMYNSVFWELEKSF